jgi:DNA-binding CsgD family transcriptional regulator
MVPQRLIDLVRSTGDVAFAIDAEGTIVAWNDVAAETLGIDERAALGTPCSDVISGSDECGSVCSRDCPIHQSAALRRPVRNFDIVMTTAAGKRWFNVSILLYAENGSPETYALHVARSVDVGKRLEMLMRDFVRETLPDAAGSPSVSINRAAIRNASLTSRETSVLRLIAQGLTTKEVADELGISAVTVSNHIQHVLAKLDAHSRLEAIRKAWYGGLI